MALDKRSARANRRMWRGLLAGTTDRRPRDRRSRCVACGKAIYADRLAAEQSVAHLRTMSTPGSWGAYLGTCGEWHVTSHAG